MNRPLLKMKFFSYLILVVLFALAPLKALAVDTDFYSSNDILFYDNTCPPGGSVEGNEDPGKNVEPILRYFTGKGLSLAAAAGIVGNLANESGLDPAKIQGGEIAPDDYVPINETGFGLAQWTFTSRQQPLVDLAKSSNRKITDLNLQLDYMWQELTTGYITVLKILDSIKSDSTNSAGYSAPVYAAIVFHSGYEGSADSAERVATVRGQSAQNAYNGFKDTVPDGTGITGVEEITPSTSAASSSSDGCDDENKGSGQLTSPVTIQKWESPLVGTGAYAGSPIGAGECSSHGGNACGLASQPGHNTFWGYGAGTNDAYDINCLDENGTFLPIYATHDGTVTEVSDVGGALERLAIEGSGFNTLYAHVIVEVGLNDSVKAGQKIATCKQLSGGSTHTHFELKDLSIPNPNIKAGNMPPYFKGVN